MDWMDRMVAMHIGEMTAVDIANDVLAQLGYVEREIAAATQRLPERMRQLAVLWIALYATRRRLPSLDKATLDAADHNTRKLAARFHSMAALAFVLDGRVIPGRDIELLIAQLDPLLRDLITCPSVAH